jgi:hypothetical protein
MSMHLHVQTPQNCRRGIAGLPHCTTAGIFAACPQGDKRGCTGF